jgi:hypothetical protein
MATLPVVITAAGLQPTAPADIRAQLAASVAATNPGYTFNLPGVLVDDVLGTDTAAVVECDQARVETVNSLTPYGANDFLLLQLGEMLGVPVGLASNTSVFVQFTCNSPGFVIVPGFIVTDGNFQYVIQDGGIIQSNGTSPLLFAIANLAGTWAVPAGTVTQLVTSVPSTITLTVVNPLPGLPGAANETSDLYRVRVLQANLAASQGMSRYLKTILNNVSGVQPRLVSVQSQVGGGWKVLVGGGDPYAVAYAIYSALFDISTLTGSIMSIATITSALPAVVGTVLNHGYSVGNNIVIASSNPVGWNGSYAVASVIDQKTFRLGKVYNANNLSAQSWAATGGGQVTFTTVAPHGVTVGSLFTIVGSTPSGYNGIFTAIAGTTGSTLVAALVSNPGTSTVTGQLSAGISNFDGSAIAAYVSGAVITPNFRNITASVVDYPDTYPVTFVSPPQQTVTLTCTWNTSSLNFVSAAAIAQLATPALVAYINSVVVGQPISVLALNDAFVNAIAGILPSSLVSKLVFAVSINGVPTSAVQQFISGDPESYFFITAVGINVVQG